MTLPLPAYRRILRYAPRYRAQWLRGFVCLIPSALPDFALLWILQQGVDRAVAGNLDRERIPLYVGGYLLCAALYGLLRFGMRWNLVGASRRLEEDLRADLYAKLLELPPQWFARQASGDLVARMTADVEAIRMTVGPGVMYVATTAATVPLALVLMFATDPVLSAFVLLPMLGMAAVFARLGPSLESASKEVQESLGDLSAEAGDGFQGLRVLKLFTREGSYVQRMEGFGERYRQAQLGMARTRGKVVAGLHVAKDLGLLAILAVGSLRVISGDLSVGAFFLFNGLLLRCFWPMVALGWMLALVHRGAAAIRRIEEILDAEVHIASPDRPEPAPRGHELSLEGVHVELGGAAVLRDVDLHVPAGSTLGITGRTGSGKSVLASLVPRLLDPSAGQVRLAGRDLREWPLDELRDRVGFVPQDAFLFSDTLAENLRYGRPEADDVELRRAAEAAGLGPDLDELPQGLQTRLGERGVTLSGGQRQRATLARALLREAPVVVLDDTLSAVDAETEARILRSWRRALRGRTCIVVSHRVAALRELDRIVVLDQGRLVESGTHEELVAAGGLYARLERRQAIEQELEEL